MSMRITFATGVCIVVAMALSVGDVRAQTFYLGGQAGWNVLEDQTGKVAGFPSTRGRFDSGYAVGARAGYEWGPWRIEEEYAYRNNGLNRLNVAGFNVPGVSGSRSSHAIMTNLLYDINLGWPVTPHVGVGIGAVNIIDSARVNGVGRVADDNDWNKWLVSAISIAVLALAGLLLLAASRVSTKNREREGAMF